MAVLAAILAAILDFSVSSRIFACYPADIYYRGPNDVKSTIKKTLSFQAGFSFGTLTILDPSVDKQSEAIGESVTCTVLLFYFIEYDVISIIFNVDLFIKHLFH